MTPSHRSDEIVLQNILTLPAKFIGLMASPQKNLLFQKNLAKAGFDENLRAKIHSPIGLPINSHTPEEIAISIAAQIIGIHNS